MVVRYFKNKETGEVIRTLKVMPPELWEEVLKAPQTKLTVLANEGTGRTKLKDMDKVLRERARNHARDVDANETIQINLANGLQDSVNRNLLNAKGERRTKLDDI